MDVPEHQTLGQLHAHGWTLERSCYPCKSSTPMSMSKLIAVFGGNFVFSKEVIEKKLSCKKCKEKTVKIDLVEPVSENKHDTQSNETLGLLLDGGYRLHWYCDACHTNAMVDLQKQIERLTRDFVWLYGALNSEMCCNKCNKSPVEIRLHGPRT